MTAALIWRQCTAQISQLNKSSNKEHCICKAVHGVFASGAAFCLPCKGRWASKASRRDFLKKIDFKKKVLRCLIPQSPAVTAPFTREPNLIPQSTHFVRSQLLTGARPFCRSATFPHTVGNHPLQGSLNNPSVCSRCSQSAPDGRESPLSLRDISPHCGESPYLREPKSPLFLPENTVKMFKTVFNTCQKVQNSKTLTICS